VAALSGVAERDTIRGRWLHGHRRHGHRVLPAVAAVPAAAIAAT
jgi:hypothetical protein